MGGENISETLIAINKYRETTANTHSVEGCSFHEMSHENLIEQNPKLVIDNERGRSNSRTNVQLKYTSTDAIHKRKIMRTELQMAPTS